MTEDTIILPNFWKEYPKLWFVQAEAQFAVAGINSEETKFNHIVANLDQSVLIHVADILEDLPGENQYRALKAAMLTRFDLSDHAKLEFLINSSHLPTNIRPSLLLAKMKELSQDLCIGSTVLRQIFIKRMPKSIQSALLVSGDDVDKLAEVADKLTNRNAEEVSGDEISKLQDQIEDLVRQIKQLQTRSRTPVRRRSLSRSHRGFDRFRSSSRQSRHHHALCWYHYKFGNRAHRCRPPCIFLQLD